MERRGWQLCAMGQYEAPKPSLYAGAPTSSYLYRAAAAPCAPKGQLSAIEFALLNAAKWPNAPVGVPRLTGPVLRNMRVSGRLCWYGNGRP